MWLWSELSRWFLRQAVLNPVVWVLFVALIYYVHHERQTSTRLWDVCALSTGHVPDSETNDKIVAACQPGTSPS